MLFALIVSIFTNNAMCLTAKRKHTDKMLIAYYV